MNILLKYSPIINAVDCSIFTSILSDYEFDRPLEEHVTEKVCENEQLRKFKVNIPLLDTLLGDDVDIESNSLSELFLSIFEYSSQLDPGVKRYDNASVIVFMSSIYKDFANNINRIIENNISSFEELKIEFGVDGCSEALLTGLFRLYLHDVLQKNGTTRSILMDFLKKYRYRENVFCEFEQFFYESDWECIVDDYLFNFTLYESTVYYYFFEFYIRSTNPKLSFATDLLDRSMSVHDISDDELVDLKSYLNEICVDDATNSLTSTYDVDLDYGKVVSSEYHDQIKINGIEVLPYLDFTFRLHTFKPLEHQLEELDIFRNNVSVYISMLNKNIKDNSCNDSLGTSYKVGCDYIRDASGKIVEREKIERLFTRWQRYLDIYDMKKSGSSLGQIVSKMHKIKEYGGTPKSPAEASKDYKEAERLILSASTLTFPY